MRITRIHIDGYGVLSEFAVDDIPPGLTVFCGPNEAGKSTLLDFIRGVLFGFPDHRHRAPFHAPVRGGRHGGSIHLATDSGAELLIERHVDAKAPVIAGPDGSARDAAEIAAVLGGADATLFRSVFAFGLDELSVFDSLDRDEIRDLVFSAGVLGAGRSATQAGRVIESRRGALVRPRSDAVANAYRRELDIIESELRSARHAATALPALLRTREDLTDALAAARRAAEVAHRRKSELERLQSAWPIFRRRTSVDDELAALTTDDDGVAVLAVAGQITDLVEERSGDRARTEQRSALVDRGRELVRSVMVARSSLGVGADARLPTWKPEAHRRAREISEAAKSVATERRSAEERRAHAASTVAEHRGTRGALEDPEAVGTPRSVDTLRAASDALRELRDHVRERDRAERASAERSTTGPTTGPGFTVSIGVLVIAIASALVLAEGRSRPAAATVLVIGAIALVAAISAIATMIRAKRSTSRATPEDSVEERRRRAIKRLAAELALADDVTEPELDTAQARLETERDLRRALDDQLDAVERDRRALRDAEETLRTIDERRHALDLEADALGRGLGLGVGADADGIGAAADTLCEIVERTTELAGIDAAISAIDDQLGSFRARLEDVAHTIGLGSGASADETLQMLRDSLRCALERQANIAELQRSSASLAAALDEALDGGADADHIRNELEKGDVPGWDEELIRIAAESGELDAAYDGALTALRDAQHEIDALGSSAAVADLELRHAGVATSLSGALEEWLVLGIAEALLDDTLERYERDRQPAVIEAAARLFATVTDRRWVGIVPREDPDNPKRRAIEVLAPSGARVAASDLSRGTAEQLYLCLRLAFAATFAERSVALPFILDDVLVNFDPERAAATAGAIATTAEDHQILAFTCHPHIVDLLVAAGSDVRVVALPRT